MLEATLGRLGIGRGVQVVAYDQDTGMFASRLWWLLRYMGHEAVAVLDGGWARWSHEGRPSREGDETRAEYAAQQWDFEIMPRIRSLVETSL